MGARGTGRGGTPEHGGTTPKYTVCSQPCALRLTRKDQRGSGFKTTLAAQPPVCCAKLSGTGTQPRTFWVTSVVFYAYWWSC